MYRQTGLLTVLSMPMFQKGGRRMKYKQLFNEAQDLIAELHQKIKQLKLKLEEEE